MTIRCNKSYVSVVSLSQYLVLDSPFHLKEALCGFSWAHPNGQHHDSCTLGPLLSKRGVPGRGAL